MIHISWCYTIRPGVPSRLRSYADKTAAMRNKQFKKITLCYCDQVVIAIFATELNKVRSATYGKHMGKVALNKHCSNNMNSF